MKWIITNNFNNIIKSDIENGIYKYDIINNILKYYSYENNIRENEICIFDTRYIFLRITKLTNTYIIEQLFL